ncbi:unnamed protein product [Larinioides sclopetarius]|uniref:Cytochrome P450 n=1 Tax=Larinioides sclopetarius TaxID=280406 RepID=A0AAV1YZE1_9ARAC
MEGGLILGALEALSPLTLLISLAVLLLLIAYFTTRDKNLPPGPVGLPYFGYWPFMNNSNCHLKLHELRKKHGDVFSFKCTGRLFINLGSLKAVREALLTKSEYFGDRVMDYNLMTHLFRDDKILMGSLMQFMADGVLSVASIIGLQIKNLIDRPEEQEKIYKEIIEVVGQDRQPVLEDKGKLIYSNAYMQETFRTVDFFNFFMSQECTKETTLGGYRIPKGAILLLNFYSCNHDTEVYEEEEKFNPSRFITKEGKKRPELPLIFGIGKRSCLGEGFVMTQIFLMLSTLIQNFHLSLSEDSKKLSMEVFFSGNLPVCAKPRQ